MKAWKGSKLENTTNKEKNQSTKTFLQMTQMGELIQGH